MYSFKCQFGQGIQWKQLGPIWHVLEMANLFHVATKYHSNIRHVELSLMESGYWCLKRDQHV